MLLKSSGLFVKVRNFSNISPHLAQNTALNQRCGKLTINWDVYRDVEVESSCSLSAKQSVAGGEDNGVAEQRSERDIEYTVVMPATADPGGDEVRHSACA